MRSMLVLILLGALGAIVADAAEGPPVQPTAAAVGPVSPAALLLLLTKRFPDIHFREIHPSAAVPGWYEVGTDSELVYSDGTGDHLFVGYVVSTSDRVNLSARRWTEMTRVDFKALPFERAIKIVRGNGSRQLVLFEDPLCPYCRQLEHNLADLTDVTIYTFLFPLESLHPGATVRSHQIWCAGDPVAAWSSWMQRKDGDPAAPETDVKGCSADPIAETHALAQQLRINSTPTMIFTDGSRITSVVPKEEIEKRLAAGAAGPVPQVNTARNN